LITGTSWWTKHRNDYGNIAAHPGGQNLLLTKGTQWWTKPSSGYRKISMDKHSITTGTSW